VRKSSGRPVGCFSVWFRRRASFRIPVVSGSAAARELTSAFVSGPAGALGSTGLAALGYKYVNIGAPTRDFQFTSSPTPSHHLVLLLANILD
jgi:hypothetical protein